MYFKCINISSSDERTFENDTSINAHQIKFCSKLAQLVKRFFKNNVTLDKNQIPISLKLALVTTFLNTNFYTFINFNLCMQLIFT